MKLHDLAPPPSAETPGTRVRLIAEPRSWWLDAAGLTGTSQGLVTPYGHEDYILVQLDDHSSRYGDHVYALEHEIELL